MQERQVYAHWLKNHPNVHSRRDFFEDVNFGGEPDERRASALPDTLLLVEQAWDGLVEKALQRGAKPVRDYLRSLSTPGAPLEKIALRRLQNLDRLIIAAALKDAEERIARHDFDGGRAKYLQIIAEYAGGDAARQAKAELEKITSLEIAHFRKLGEEHFKTEVKLNVPQTRAREYFERMYRATGESGPQADYALLMWSRALATENKIPQALEQLRRWEKQFPVSALRPRALFLLGFLSAERSMQKYDDAIHWLTQLTTQYPNADETAEAWWYLSFYQARAGRFGEAVAALQAVKRYPKSVRQPHADKWIGIFQQKAATGGKWP